MKPRLIIIFSLIVIIPVSTIIWLGISLSQRERTVIKDQFREISLSNMHEYNDLIAQKLESLEIHFSDSNKNTTLDNARLNRPKETLVNQLFILNKDRQLTFPNPKSKDLSEKEKGFLARTQVIWESGEVFYRPEEYEVQAQTISQQEEEQNSYPGNDLSSFLDSAPQQSSNNDGSRSRSRRQQVVLQGNFNDSYTNTFNSNPITESSMGWYSWFHGRGLNFILWKRTTNDEIVGYELNRDEIINHVVSALPQSSSNETQSFQLKNTAGVIHSWGDFNPAENQEPIATLNLNPPLQSWELRCFFNDSHLTAASINTILYNYVLGGAILGLIILSLCIYFYRENSRQLRESSQKVNFVNQVSHELKTPLTNIRMYAELLERNLMDENLKAQKQLNVIVSESQRLSRLISNVLSFAQKDKKKLKLNIRKTDINSLVKSVIESYSPVLARKNIKINSQIEELPEIDADPDGVEQILGNLLSNVEKYVQSGGEVTISTSLNQENISIVISDNGPGIPIKLKDKVFEAFQRVSNKLSDGVAGTGIGLTISRELAEMHGGSLTLEPSDKGAAFKLTLPKLTGK